MIFKILEKNIINENGKLKINSSQQNLEKIYNINKK